MGDHRLLEDGCERGGALVSDAVELETASDGWDGDGDRVGVSMGADTKANTIWGGVAHLRLVICVSLRIAASAETPLTPMQLASILRGMGGGRVRGQVRVSGR